MPVAESGQKTFPGVGTKPGVEIWRIEVDNCKFVCNNKEWLEMVFDLKPEYYKLYEFFMGLD